MAANVKALAVLMCIGLAGCGATSSSENNQGDVTGSLGQGIGSLPSLPGVRNLVPSLGSPSSHVERIGGNLYRISLTGSGFADARQREDYLTQRAAEVTQAAGGTHFTFVTLGGQAGGGGAEVSNSDLMFRVVTIVSDAEAPSGAISAAATLQSLGVASDRQMAGGQSAGLPTLPSTNWGPAAAPSDDAASKGATVTDGDASIDDRAPVKRNPKLGKTKPKPTGTGTTGTGTTGTEKQSVTKETLPALRGT